MEPGPNGSRKTDDSLEDEPTESGVPRGDSYATGYGIEHIVVDDGMDEEPSKA